MKTPAPIRLYSYLKKRPTDVFTGDEIAKTFKINRYQTYRLLRTLVQNKLALTVSLGGKNRYKENSRPNYVLMPYAFYMLQGEIMPDLEQYEKERADYLIRKTLEEYEPPKHTLLYKIKRKIFDIRCYIAELILPYEEY